MPKSESDAIELQHSLVRHHLDSMRTESTTPAAFRTHVKVLSLLLVAEAARCLEIEEYPSNTPLEPISAGRLKGANCGCSHSSSWFGNV